MLTQIIWDKVQVFDPLITITLYRYKTSKNLLNSTIQCNLHYTCTCITMQTENLILKTDFKS